MNALLLLVHHRFYAEQLQKNPGRGVPSRYFTSWNLHFWRVFPLKFEELTFEIALRLILGGWSNRAVFHVDRKQLMDVSVGFRSVEISVEELKRQEPGSWNPENRK